MTLHLAKLTLNLQSRQARKDLADPYDMHRTLNRAFTGPDGLSPFLWRLEDSRPGELPVLLVQSKDAPDWQQLPERWSVDQAQRVWEPEKVIRPGQWVRFRVLVNPTITTVPKGVDVQGSARGHRKRLGLTKAEDQLGWLQRQGQRLGLRDMDATVVRSGKVRSSKKKGHPMTVVIALLEGQALVGDAAALAGGIRTGIGHARMLGLGLISVAPL
ncbi:MAG: type I-E CRISPR-associated protein Cas6/Cse3/CasE [Cyanobacteria bacterium MAG CAR1_bin_15]|nr:type I-E CRISPR-associated protein Cas6/Cse3/CasE [Cyanobacteria bacterium MAG CAR1_bin_15]